LQSSFYVGTADSLLDLLLLWLTVRLAQSLFRA
jgi:hypothetical protein